MALAYFQLALSMALVGANVGVAKLLAEALPIPMIAGLRCALAVLLLWPLARVLESRVRLDRRVLWNLALQAAFGTVIYNAGLLAGLRLTTALEAGLVLATLPAVVALGGALWLRERLPPRQWAAVALAAGGMAAITAARVAADGHGSLLGNLLVFGGVCGEAMYVLLAKRIAGQVPVVTASFWMQLFSVLMLLPFCLPVLGGGRRAGRSAGLGAAGVPQRDGQRAVPAVVVRRAASRTRGCCGHLHRLSAGDGSGGGGGLSGRAVLRGACGGVRAVDRQHAAGHLAGAARPELTAGAASALMTACGISLR